jgi:hypothetical protein
MRSAWQNSGSDAMRQAKLFAAAADLLEALEFVLDRVDWDNERFSSRVVAKNKAIEAIKKATT